VLDRRPRRCADGRVHPGGVSAARQHRDFLHVRTLRIYPLRLPFIPAAAVDTILAILAFFLLAALLALLALLTAIAHGASSVSV
jgi:hypothetical protein